MSGVYLCGRTAKVKPSKAAPVSRPMPPAANYFAQDAAERCAKLYPRQREVLVLMCKGLRLREIAGAMGISLNTVNEHKSALYRALEVGGAVEAGVLAAKAGLV